MIDTDWPGPGFIERPWLVDAVARSAAEETTRYVLVTGQPGIGKTTFLRGLVREHPDWLSVSLHHDARDLPSFLLSVGHQFARHRPELFEPERLTVVVHQQADQVAPDGRMVGLRIDDLAASPFHHTAILEVEQRITRLEGTAHGVEIGRATVDPRLLEPDTLAQLGLIGPAELLRREQPDARILIVLDALDELAADPGPSALLDWLARGPELPPNIRIVLSSRPHSALDRLRASRSGQLREITIDPLSARVRADLAAHFDHVLSSAAVSSAVAAEGLLIDQFRRDVVLHAAGNFLYLSLYARALNDAIDRDEPEAVRTLVREIETAAFGLEPLYALLVETARAEVARLGMLDIRDDDAVTAAWEGVALPVLGVLTVARDRVGVEQLTALAGLRVWPSAVRRVVSTLRWMLDERDGAVRLFHAAIGEFLGSEQARHEHPGWAVDPEEWHARIVRHYRGRFSIDWADVDWAVVDDYGLIHLADHAICAGTGVADRIVELPGPGARHAMRARFGSDLPFLAMVDRIAEHLRTSAPGASSVPAVLRLAVLRRQVGRSASGPVPAALGLLARLGRIEQALVRLRTLPSPIQRFDGALELLPSVGNRVDELLELLVESALSTPADGHDSRGRAVRLAATHLAVRDLPRALRLLEHATNSAPPWPHPPDPVLRAAAAVLPVPEAVAVAESVRDWRSDVYLGLAGRAEPDDLLGLLRLAEANLPTDESPWRGCLVRGLAGLTAAWRPIDNGESDRFRANLLADIAAPERGMHSDFATGLVDGAYTLADIDRRSAVRLLHRLVDVPIGDRQIGPALLRAARLWARWGSVDEARQVLARLIEWNDRSIQVASRRLDVYVDATGPSPVVHNAMEETYGAVALVRTIHQVLTEVSEEGVRETVAYRLAEHHLRRAATLEWYRSSAVVEDRATQLARLGHAHLDTGDVDAANRLLTESLELAESAPPLTRHSADGVLWSADDSKPDDVTGRSVRYNQVQWWTRLRDTRFFHDPSEVVEAMSIGPHTIGNPFSWGRSARILAGRIAGQDLERASQVIERLTDPGETAVGLASLYAAAKQSGDRYAHWALGLAVQFDDSLMDLPRLRWLLPDHAGDDAFAYVRPDHRARFDIAVTMIPWAAENALRLLERGAARYLPYAFLHVAGVHASMVCAQYVSRGEQPPPWLLRMHQLSLTKPAAPERLDLLLSTIDRARAIAEDHRMAETIGRAPVLTPPIDDLRYDAYVRLMADRSVGPEFRQRVRGLLDGTQLPAAAGLIAFAAELPTVRADDVAELAGEIVAAARQAPPETRLPTLLLLAASPVLGHFVDTVALLAEAEQLGTRPWQQAMREDALMALFPVLLTSEPAHALRLLREAVEENWSRAMALLEHAADELVDALGVDVVTILDDAIRQGITCASPGGSPPDNVDGVAPAR
ncbi:MAG: hypothetical protein DLM62_11535 [Pseudonocardiales bacterium]|nr:MAG: hypothetical protein DLM62_11535 [Pseudonocardiales bacterium]